RVTRIQKIMPVLCGMAAPSPNQLVSIWFLFCIRYRRANHCRAWEMRLIVCAGRAMRYDFMARTRSARGDHPMLRKIAAVIAALMSLAAAAQAADPTMKVTLLGTAGPEYFPDRLGISTLVEANGELLLFDVGRGANQRLYQSRINPKDIARIFLTHLHNDHFEGLPDLWMTPWFLLGCDHGFDLWGPDGTEEMVNCMPAMFGHDCQARVNQFNPISTLAIQSHIVKDGVVFERNGVKVTAFSVEHADGNPAFGYQVDWNGRRVVLSGDTTLSENVIKA